MATPCPPKSLSFSPSSRRSGARSMRGRSDDLGRGRAAAARAGFAPRAGAAFAAVRWGLPPPTSVQPKLRPLLAQRVIGLARGYEARTAHDAWRRAPLLALVVGRPDWTGVRRAPRARRRNGTCALAGASPSTRLEWGDEGAVADRTCALVDPTGAGPVRVEVCLESSAEPPEAIWLDLDAPADPWYGNPQGRFCPGDSGHSCSLPVSILCGVSLRCARLREAEVAPAAGSVEAWERIVGQLRPRGPRVPPVVRDASGFGREAVMAWGA